MVYVWRKEGNREKGFFFLSFIFPDGGREGGRESEITEKQKNKGVLRAHFLSHPVGAQVTQARPGGQGAEQGGGTLPDARDQQTTNALTPLRAQEKSVPPTTDPASGQSITACIAEVVEATNKYRGVRRMEE